MPFQDIIEQTAAIQRLQIFLDSGRVPNSLLFVGPWGVGKTRTALTFARALNCLEEEKDACDDCTSCRKALKFMHPDIRFLFPMPHGKKQGKARVEEEEKQEASELTSMTENLFHIIQFERNASIWIEKTREMIRASALTCSEGRRKVFVLREADRMNATQANSILKSLEEPPPDTHFVLTSSRPQALLSTIVSRCQRVDFAPIGRDAMVEVLRSEKGLAAVDAKLCAALAQGSIGRSLMMADEDVRQLRDQALAVLAAAERGGPHLHAVVEEIAKARDRNLIRRLAHALAVWHGDLLSVRYGFGKERVANVDRLSELKEQAAVVSVEEIRRRLGLFEELRASMDQNVGYQVAMYWLVAALGETGTCQLAVME